MEVGARLQKKVDNLKGLYTKSGKMTKKNIGSGVRTSTR